MSGKNTILENLDKLGYIVSKVNGRSMRPLLNHKTTQVYIKGGIKPKKNDVILFKRGNIQLVLHRVVKVKTNYYVVVGDNQSISEDVNVDQVKGVMTHFYKNGQRKNIYGFKYRAYLLYVKITRPIRFVRDGFKFIFRKLFS